MIIGPTNVGKSSLFNLLVQEEKMIVSPIRGTTTDQSMQSIDVAGKKSKHHRLCWHKESTKYYRS